jgi:Tfp pilus assembly protein PilX
MKTILIKSERGIVSVIAILMVGMLTLLGLAAMSTSDDEVSIAGNELHETRAFYAAEAGLNTAIADIQRQYEVTGLPPATLPSGTLTLNNSQVTYRSIDNGPVVQTKLSSGSLAGLSASVKSYTISSTAVNNLDRAQMSNSMQFQLMSIPIVEFGVFYQNDLLMSPTAAWTVTGRVHTNGHGYVQSSAALNFSSNVTAAGSVFHGLPNGQFSGTATSDVSFKDANNSYQTMKVGGVWLDANDPNWYANASARWAGHVRDLAFGERPLKLSLSGTTDAHKLIERESGNPNSYESKASLKFIDNSAYQLVGGVWIDVTALMTGFGIISFGADRFYDERQAKWVDVLDMDIALLKTKGYDPVNGIMYFSSTIGDYPALRLINGTSFGDPMTIVSRNPMYTIGNMNSNNMKPLAFICDALTILSGSWDDASSSLAKNQRNCNVNMTVNAAIITGDCLWTGANYQGGLENLASLLESWNGAKTLTITGAFASLWRSQQAVGEWSSVYYNAPGRAYTHDVLFDNPANHPPSMPTVMTINIAQWSQAHVGVELP